MELTPGILKSIESAVIVTFNDLVQVDLFVVKYKGRIYTQENKPKVFYSKKTAKKFLVQWVKNIFWQGEYWQSCSSNIKKQRNYDVDFSATIKILPQYGLTKRFDLPEQMFKDIADELLAKEIFTIEKYIINDRQA
jgi:hypothetical protein